MANPRKYLNHLEYIPTAVGNERRLEMLGDILDKSTFVPRAVEYKDIDSAFKEWVENSLKISYNSKILPTMVLYSNQRFTEYSQTWEFTDENKNLLLNFKTITRENNPEYGHIQGGLWNIPGENRFYHMKRVIVLDDNGSESFLDLSMRQPMAIDLNYTVSIFATHLDPINEFNMLVNNRFKARQDYIAPNSHYMPMTLEGISDKSSYELNDRQFYSQSYTIKVMAYIIREDDFRISETPLKRGAKFRGVFGKKKTAKIDVEEYANPCNEPDREERYYNKPVNVIVEYPECVKKTMFSLDEDFVIENVETKNVRRFTIKINDEEVDWKNIRVNEGSTIYIEIVRLNAGETAKVTLEGYDPNVMYDSEKDNPELDIDDEQKTDEYVVDV